MIRLGGPAHDIVIKTVHKTLPGGGAVEGSRHSKRSGGEGGRGGVLTSELKSNH